MHNKSDTNNTVPTVSEARLASCLDEISTRFRVDFHQIADRCGVTYQTVKNMADGKSVGARFTSGLIKTFKLDTDLPLLRRILLGFLASQFGPTEETGGETGENLLVKAGFLK